MEETPNQNKALFSLVAGEGDGLMLGIAAGDSAGGAWELGYSAVTQQATVIAYQLIEHRHLESHQVVASLREMDGSQDGVSVYRSSTPQFRVWLDATAAGAAAVTEEPSLDGVVRTAPLGVAFRKEPDKVVDETLTLARLFDADASSIVAGLVSASAVAASCFGQSGKDLIAGVAEIVLGATDDVGEWAARSERLAGLERVFARLVDAVGVVEAGEAIRVAGDDPEDPLQMMLAGLLLAAPVTDRHHGPVEQAARLGGSVLGAAVGGIMGARLGIRAWPWAFANDTWFAEIGRRLSRGPDEVRDLPIPYAVEQHLMTGPNPSFH